MNINVIQGDKMIGVENLMIELDNFDEYQEQDNKENINNKKKLKKHNKLKDKNKNKYLELLKSSKVKRKEKKSIIVIDEKDNGEQKKDQKNKDIFQSKQKSIITTIKNKDEMKNINKQVLNFKEEQMCNKNFQDNLRIKQKTTNQNKNIKNEEIQTDNICDIKKLEIFHLLKISQNFILSMHSLTEKIIKMYV